MGKVTQGRRKQPDAQGDLRLAEGEYGKDSRGHWYGRVPGGHMGNLSGHDVTEHEDGTITVSPSILVGTTDEHGEPVTAWHGFLERGVWREC